MQQHLTVFLNVRRLDKKMPNGGTKTLAGDGSAIAPDDKALDEMGLTASTRMCRKSEEESALSPVLQDAVMEVSLVRKSPEREGSTGKPGQEDAVRRNKNLPGHQYFKTLNVRCLPKKPRTTRHLTRRTDNKQKDSENDCNMFLPLPLSL
jgi:hypothetical protein